MIHAIALVLLLAAAPPQQSTQPRQYDPDQAEAKAGRDRETTDPWFDRAQVATDDPAFVLVAVQNSRQGIMDARDAAARLDNPQIRTAAQKIGAQNEAVTRRLEKIASARGWRLPEPNPQQQRTAPLPAANATRANANFILQQISYHQDTLDHYRAQIAGKGDPELKKALRQALPGYQQNLELLLKLKP